MKKVGKLNKMALLTAVSAAEAALFLGVTRQRISAMIRDGEIEVIRIGTRRMRVTKASLLAYIERRRQRGIEPAVDISYLCQ